MHGKLIENKTINTFTFEYENAIYNGFMVDIVCTAETFDAFLYHKDFATKEFIFGLPKEQNDFDEAKLIFKNSLPDYIPDYIKQYIND